MCLTCFVGKQHSRWRISLQTGQALAANSQLTLAAMFLELQDVQQWHDRDISKLFLAEDHLDLEYKPVLDS